LDHRAGTPQVRDNDPAERLPSPVIHLITWPSLALGVVALACPTDTATAIGLKSRIGSRVIRIAGWRELVVLGAFLLRPTRRSLWAFVAQDLCDITAATIALSTRSDVILSPRRLRAALTGYGLLAVADLYTAVRHGRVAPV
jgi:hypothetical protein